MSALNLIKTMMDELFEKFKSLPPEKQKEIQEKREKFERFFPKKRLEIYKVHEMAMTKIHTER